MWPHHNLFYYYFLTCHPVTEKTKYFTSQPNKYYAPLAYILEVLWVWKLCSGWKQNWRKKTYEFLSFRADLSISLFVISAPLPPILVVKTCIWSIPLPLRFRCCFVSADKLQISFPSGEKHATIPQRTMTGSVTHGMHRKWPRHAGLADLGMITKPLFSEPFFRNQRHLLVLL